jgi:BirA family biotin operon repressor/biotin-[acetyl-CoA-carboxylase] ligase
MTELFSLFKNRALLLNNSIGSAFIELHTTESTNNYAMGLVHEGLAQHGTAVFAHAQTQGRGQRTKEWLSEPGKNIALTLIIEPKGLNLSESFLLSMAIATAVQQSVTNYLGDYVTIKWPNDIYWRDRKAGGILIENVFQGSNWKYALVGIGLNINQTHFPGLNNKAVSFKQVTGKDFEPVALAKELCALANDWFLKLINNPPSIIESYKGSLYKLNEPVRLRKGTRVFSAVIKDVTTAGELVVQHAMEERFNVGEVEWLINP